MATIAELGDVVVNILGEDAKLKAALSGGMAMLKKFGAAAAGVVGGYFSIKAASAAVADYAEAEKGELGLAAAIKTRGGVVSDLLPVMDEYAKQRMISVGMDDDAIKSAMAYGMQLGVSKDKIQEATDAAIGLSAKLGMDLNSAMNLIGRASTGNTQMLSRYGVQIDKTKSAAEQFQQVLNFGKNGMGLAEAQAASLSGSIAAVKVGFGEVTEGIGGMLAESLALPEVFKAIAGGLQNIAGWFDKMKPKFIEFGGGLKKFAVDTAEFLGMVTKEEAERTKAAIDKQTADKISGMDKEKAVADVTAQDVIMKEEKKQKAIKDTMASRLSFADVNKSFQDMILNNKAEDAAKTPKAGIGNFNAEMEKYKADEAKKEAEQIRLMKEQTQIDHSILDAIKGNKPLPVMG